MPFKALSFNKSKKLQAAFCNKQAAIFSLWRTDKKLIVDAKADERFRYKKETLTK